ncbi:MAG TPA: hypothetical protein PLL69_12715 [Gemmatimonadales bacterium]|nr:hypothetical protein [Gemmatimonadales bacterium]
MTPLVAVMLFVIGITWWMLDPIRGMQHSWPGAPGGELRFRLRYRSPAALLWLGRKGNCGLAVFGVVHIRERQVSAPLLAHELAHLCRMRSGQWSYLARYLFVPSFRRAEEVACWEFAEEHRQDPVLIGLAEA